MQELFEFHPLAKGSPIFPNKTRGTKYIILRNHGTTAWTSAASTMKALPSQFLPADRSLSEMAAIYKADQRISLADAFAAALSKTKRAYLVTGDREFKTLEHQIKIKWLI